MSSGNKSAEKTMNEFDSLMKILTGWAKPLCRNSYFQNCYLFGSLINRDGEQFVSSGQLESDVDLVLRLSEEASSALERVSACSKLAEKVYNLEISLLQTLKRSSASHPITSIVLATSYELYHGIHKGNDPIIFLSPQFIDLTAKSKDKYKRIPLTDHIDAKFYIDFIECISIIKYTQSVRNHYLRISANKTRPISLTYDGPEIFPKEVLRHAAMYQFFDGKCDIADRTDLNQGLEYMLNLMISIKNDDQNYNKLHEKILRRASPRGKKPQITPDDYLLIWEILFDRAIQSIPKTAREIIDEMSV